MNPSPFRYAKLKLVAIKLKKRTLEQEKKIKDLESSSSQGGSSSNSTKFATLLQNFNSLQQQNDEQGDVIETQKKQLSSLRKDLETSATDCAETKSRLAAADDELSVLRSTHARVSGEREEKAKTLGQQEGRLAKQEKVQLFSLF